MQGKNIFKNVGVLEINKFKNKYRIPAIKKYLSRTEMQLLDKIESQDK